MSFADQIKLTKEKGPNRNPFVKYLPKEWQIIEVILNNETIQKQWAKENNFKCKDPGNWIYEIVKAQILWFKPDVVYITTYSTFPYSFLRDIKAELKMPCLWINYYGLRLRNILADFRGYDLVLTGWKACLDELRENNINSEYFPQYMDNAFADEALKIEKKDIPFSFAGSVSWGGDDLNERREYIDILIKKCNLMVWTSLKTENCRNYEYYRLLYNQKCYDLYQYLKSGIFSSIADLLPKVKNYKYMEKRPDTSIFIEKSIIKNCKPPVFGKEIYKILRRSMLTFNSYVRMDVKGGKIPYCAGNIRLFESAGVETCVLTKYTDDLKNFFIPDEEIATFNSKEEAVEKARFLLENSRIREQMAKKARHKVEKFHTAKIRAKEFINFVKQNI